MFAGENNWPQIWSVEIAIIDRKSCLANPDTSQKMIDCNLITLWKCAIIEVRK